MGEGLGVGWCNVATLVHHGTTPLPNPPPQGGREQTEFVVRAELHFTKTALAHAPVTLVRCPRRLVERLGVLYNDRQS